MNEHIISLLEIKQNKALKARMIYMRRKNEIKPIKVIKPIKEKAEIFNVKQGKYEIDFL